MFAQLPMYDHPAMRPVTDALWREIRERLRAGGIAAPEALTRDADLMQQWRNPRLLLGQTCGLPFRAGLHRHVTLLGAFDFGLRDTPPGYYRSVFVARDDDPRPTLADFANARLAFNEPMSQSGWAAAAAEVRFEPGPVTGSHAASAIAVARGDAEIAAIDAVTWRLLRRHLPEAARLRVVGQSEATPGLPLITAFADLADRLRAAIAGGIADLGTPARDGLGPRGFVPLAPAAYLEVPIPPSPEAYAAAAG